MLERVRRLRDVVIQRCRTSPFKSEAPSQQGGSRVLAFNDVEVRGFSYGCLMREADGPEVRDNATPWLLDLAVRQRDSGPPPGSPVYDDASQMTYLREPVYEAAIDSAAGVVTKKADRETGEDQKGF